MSLLKYGLPGTARLFHILAYQFVKSTFRELITMEIHKNLTSLSLLA